MLTAYRDRVSGLLEAQADEEGQLDAIGMFSVVAEASELWRETFQAWSQMFQAARREAAAIPFGRLAREHQAMMELAERALTEQEAGDASPVFNPQLQAVLDAANKRLYSDGFQLSERIWRLDRDSLEGIRRTLLRGIAEGDSAWKVAQELGAYLGADADCPRWASTRLFKLTPTDRMTSRKGLYSRVKGTPCESKGVAYNALRLARNEIQIAHHMATDALLGRAPWVEMEQVMLSPDHPLIGCACEDIVAGGEDGDGVYPKGEITLPIHVQCLCYKVAVLMDADAFVDRLGGWMRKETVWPEMDAYAGYIGVRVDDPRLLEPGLLMSWGVSLVTWLWGNEEVLKAALGLTSS